MLQPLLRDIVLNRDKLADPSGVDHLECGVVLCVRGLVGPEDLEEVLRVRMHPVEELVDLTTTATTNVIMLAIDPRFAPLGLRDLRCGTGGRRLERRLLFQ